MYNPSKLTQYLFHIHNGVPCLIEEDEVSVVGIKEVGIHWMIDNLYVFAHDLPQALSLVKDHLINRQMKCWELRGIYDVHQNYIYFEPPVLKWKTDIPSLPWVTVKNTIPLALGAGREYGADNKVKGMRGRTTRACS